MIHDDFKLCDNHLSQPHSDHHPGRHHQAQNSSDDNRHHKSCSRLQTIFSPQDTVHIEHILNGHDPEIFGVLDKLV